MDATPETHARITEPRISAWTVLSFVGRSIFRLPYYAFAILGYLFRLVILLLLFDIAAMVF